MGRAYPQRTGDEPCLCSVQLPALIVTSPYERSIYITASHHKAASGVSLA